MKDNYSFKVQLFRLAFELLVLSCYVLNAYGLVDYILLIILIIAFGSIFTISTVNLTSTEINIKKGYFWGLYQIRKNVNFGNILDIQSKVYDIEANSDTGATADGFLGAILLEYFKPKVAWVTTIVTYTANGENKRIEVKITKNDFKAIEKNIAVKYNKHSLPVEQSNLPNPSNES